MKNLNNIVNPQPQVDIDQDSESRGLAMGLF